jgi:hypothetical protein
MAQKRGSDEEKSQMRVYAPNVEIISSKFQNLAEIMVLFL